MKNTGRNLIGAQVDVIGKKLFAIVLDHDEKCMFFFLKLLLIVAIFCLQTNPVQAASNFQGSLKSVTISDTGGTNTPPTAIISYTQDGDSVTFNGGQSTDTDGQVTGYKWMVDDLVVSSEEAFTHNFVDETPIKVTLTVYDEAGGIAIVQESVSSVPPFQLAVNFQPASSVPPSGFVPDSGEMYDSQAGYGWLTALANTYPKERNSSLAPGKEYDTYFYVDPNAVWEASLPNGTYSVTVCVGEPLYPFGVQNVQAEGLPVIVSQELGGVKWIEETKSVDITDGKLTLTFSGGTDKIIVAWLKID